MSDDQRKERFGKAINDISEAYYAAYEGHMARGEFAAALESLLAGRCVEMREFGPALKYAGEHWNSLERIEDQA